MLARHFILTWLSVNLAILPLSCSKRESVSFSSQAAKRPERIEAHTEMVRSVALSPDGKMLASAGDEGTLKLWDMASGENLATLQGSGPFSITSVAFSPDGKTLAAGGGGGVPNVWLWDAATRKQKAALKDHFLRIAAVAFSPDGTTLAAGGAGDVTLWSLTENKKKSTLAGHSGVKSIAYSPDGKTMAATSAADIKIWDVDSGKEQSVLKGHTALVEAIVFSPDGKLLASASDDKTIKLWDTATKQNTSTLTGHGGFVDSVAFSPDGKKLASASQDGTARLWDVASGKEKASIQTQDGVYSVLFTADGKTVVCGLYHAIKFWDVGALP